MMAAAVVAGAARERQRRQQLEKRKAQFERQRQSDDRAAAAYIGQLDSDGIGALTRAQVQQLLLYVTKHAHVDDDGLDMVMSAAQKHAHMAPTFPKEHAMVPRAAVLQAVVSYRLYLSKRAEIDALFRRWDFDFNDALDRSELRALITEKEANLPPSEKRAVLGLITELRPSAADVDFIMKECDSNADGLISKAELLPALAVWAELAEQKIAAQSACCCAIS